MRRIMLRECKLSSAAISTVSSARIGSAGGINRQSHPARGLRRPMSSGGLGTNTRDENCDGDTAVVSGDVAHALGQLVDRSIAARENVGVTYSENEIAAEVATLPVRNSVAATLSMAPAKLIGSVVRARVLASRRVRGFAQPRCVRRTATSSGRPAG